MNPTTLKTIFTFLFLIFIYSIGFADTLKLIDGSAVQGKIVREDDRMYYFTNSFGTFEVKKVNVTKVFITNSYEEDIKISKANNLKIDEKNAKKNYEVGMRKKNIMGKSKSYKKYFEYWDYGRLSISAAYFFTVSARNDGGKTINTKLPNGFSGVLAYEQGLDMLLLLGSDKTSKDSTKTNKDSKTKRKYIKTKPRPPLMPGLRIEFSYLYFTKDVFVNDDQEVSGSMYTLGPMWSMPSPHNVWGCFVIAALPGMSFIRVNNRETNRQRDDYTFGMTLIFGYEYAIKEKVGLLFHSRYTFIADQKVSFHGIGVSFGLAFRLW